VTVTDAVVKDVMLGLGLELGLELEGALAL